MPEMLCELHHVIVLKTNYVHYSARHAQAELQHCVFHSPNDRLEPHLLSRQLHMDQPRNS